MLCDPTSYYPQKIDEMTFFQDSNLENTEVMNHYNNLLAQGKYSEASDYIDQQEGIYGFFADYFNLIENRIYALQEYLLQKPPKKQLFLYYAEKKYPSLAISIFTDTDDEEDPDTILWFSDDAHHESLETLHLFINDNELEKEEAEPPLITPDTIWI